MPQLETDYGGRTLYAWDVQSPDIRQGYCRVWAETEHEARRIVLNRGHRVGNITRAEGGFDRGEREE